MSTTRLGRSLPPRSAFVPTLLPSDAPSTMRSAQSILQPCRLRAAVGRTTIASSHLAAPTWSVPARHFVTAASLAQHQHLTNLRSPHSRNSPSIRGIHTWSRQLAARSQPDAASSAAASSSPAEWSAFPPLQPHQFLLGYLAHPGRLDDMLEEIDAQENAATLGLRASVLQIHGNLVIVRVDASSSDRTSIPPNMLHPLRCATIWYQPQLLSFPSISVAARSLRKSGAEQAGRGLKWSCYDAVDGLRRRAALVAEDLPHVDKRMDEMMLFPLDMLPTAKVVAAHPASPAASSPPADTPLRSPGCFTLLTPNQLLFSPSTSSPFPNGFLEFVYDRQAPPSRAYLKLYEALTRMQVRLMQRHGIQQGQRLWDARKPQPGQVVLDLGSAPGGWTWAAAVSCGASVLSIDRAPLDRRVSSLKNVRHVIRSGFSVEPTEQEVQDMLREREEKRVAQRVRGASDPPATSSPRRVDWLLCDIISYPDRALSLIQRWLQADAVQHGMVVTIKLQSVGGTSSDDTSDGESAPPASRPSKGPAQQYHLQLQPEILRQLRAIPHGELVHLCANKNEATFMWMREPEAQRGEETAAMNDRAAKM